MLKCTKHILKGHTVLRGGLEQWVARLIVIGGYLSVVSSSPIKGPPLFP